MRVKIFVYGTLLKGFRNWNWFLNKPDVKFLGEDVITGKFTMVALYNFPGVVLNDNKPNNKIYGEVYEIDEQTLYNIDCLEGYDPDPKQTFYSKIIVPTKYGDAQMYVLNESYLQYPEIETGSWKDY